MFILYAVALGVLAGFLWGGRLANLAGLRIRWPAAIVGGIVAQVILFTGPVTARIGDLGPPLYVLSTLVVVAAVARNWRIAGMPIVLAGAACNLAAIVANGGYMPAAAAAMAAAGRLPGTEYTNSSFVPDPVLWPLTDIFALPRWLPFHNVFSVGDVLIGIGIAVVVAAAMRRRPSDEPGDRAGLPAGGASGQ